MTRRASHGWSASVALGQRGATRANWDPRLVPLDLRSSDRVLYVVRARIVRPVQSRKPRATRVNASPAAMDAVPAKVRNGALLLARIRGAGPVGSDTPAPLRTRYSARARPNRSRPFQFSSDARASVDASSRTENEAAVRSRGSERSAGFGWLSGRAVDGDLMVRWLARVLRRPGLAGRPRRCSARRRRGRVTA